MIYLFCYRALNDRILTDKVVADSQQQAINIFRTFNGTVEILAITKIEKHVEEENNESSND